MRNCTFCGARANSAVCPECQYPLEWNEGIAVDAPDSLIDLSRCAKQSSGLYSVFSTGLILKARVKEIASELRAIGRYSDNNLIHRHYVAVNHLNLLLPE